MPATMPMPMDAQAQGMEDSLTPQEVAQYESERGVAFKDEYARAKEVRKLQEGDWYMSFAYLRDMLYTRWNGTDGTYAPIPKSDPDEIRTNINYFSNYVRTFHSKITTGQRIEFSPQPMNGEDRKRSARITKALLRQWWEDRHNGVSATWNLASYYGLIFPVWLYIWPEQTGEKPIQSPTGQTIIDAGTNQPVPELGVQIVPTYRVLMDFIMPFDVWVIPGSNTSIMQRWPGIIVRKRITKEQARAEYGRDDLPTGTPSDRDPVLELVMDSNDPMRSRSDQSKITIYERWEQPSSEFREGRYEVFDINGQYITGQDFIPYHLKGIPFVPVYEQDSVGNYPTETVRHLRGIQREINFAYNQWFEGIRKYCQPKVIIPARSIHPNTGRWTGRAGQMIHLNVGGQPPHYMEPPHLYAGMPLLINQLLQDLERVGGLSEVSSRGQLPVRAQTLGQTNAILSQDVSRLDSVRTAREDALAAAAEIALAYYQRLFPYEDTIKITGIGTLTSIEKWKSEDLDDEYTVSVRIGNGFGYDKASRISLVAAMLGQQPLLGNNLLSPEDRKLAMEIAELGDIGTLDPQQKQRDFAEKENEILVQGKPVAPIPGVTDPFIHLPIHRNKYLDIQMDATIGPEAKEIALEFLLTHITMEQQMIAPVPPEEPEGEGGNTEGNGKPRGDKDSERSGEQ